MSKVRLPPIGFWSYARQDDQLSQRKRLNSLRALLMAELQQLYGRQPIQLFQDITTIPHGAAWEREIKKALNKTTFFIPIITPNFIQSGWCCREVIAFIEREQQLFSLYPDLPEQSHIFPIHYIDISEVDPENPEALEALRKLQWFDFRAFRHTNFEDEAVQKALSGFAESICEVLQVKVEAPPTAEERARREMAEAAARKEAAEAERRRQEGEERAEAARIAREAEAEATRRQQAEAAEAELRRREKEAEEARHAEEKAAAARHREEEAKEAERRRREAEAEVAREAEERAAASRRREEEEAEAERLRREKEVAEAHRAEKAEAAQLLAQAPHRPSVPDEMDREVERPVPTFPYWRGAILVAAALLVVMTFAIWDRPNPQAVEYPASNNSADFDEPSAPSETAPTEAAWLNGEWKDVKGEDCTTSIRASGNRLITIYRGMPIEAEIVEASAEKVTTVTTALGQPEVLRSYTADKDNVKYIIDGVSFTLVRCGSP